MCVLRTYPKWNVILLKMQYKYSTQRKICISTFLSKYWLSTTVVKLKKWPIPEARALEGEPSADFSKFLDLIRAGHCCIGNVMKQLLQNKRYGPDHAQM